ncbi:MAG: large conductance mechanosensitive channel protein MscL [Clostridiales bacterium]|nr:large conductance mechanosensitive channel protein MscL [Clostridiales bacterium]
MRKFFKEFKEFITRGNVIDLAVGMIIGAAFTAIVTALVNGVFKPLINAIPMGDMSGLITMLKPAYMLDADGVKVLDLANSIYINWGELIMAIISFLITAMVLFLIIKAINTFRTNAEKLKGAKIDKELKAELKAKGMNKKQMIEYVAAQKAEEEAKAKAEAEANKPETAEQILAEIRELLKAQQK